MKSNNTQDEKQEKQSLLSKIAASGAYWIIPKGVTNNLGVEETVILMEHVSFGSGYKKNDGYYYRTKDALVKVLPYGATCIQQKENKLIDLGLIIRVQRGQDRRNYYKINEENLTLFTENPHKYIKKIKPEYLSKNTMRKRGIIADPHTSPNAASSNTPQRPKKNIIKEPISLLRKESIGAKETAPITDNSNIDSSMFIPKKRILTGYVDVNLSLNSKELPKSNNIESTSPIMTRSGMNKSLKEKTEKVVISNRKVPNTVINLIEYWNTLPGVRVHGLKYEKDVCLLDIQTRAVKDISMHIKQLLRGELYAASQDIIQPVVRTMKFTVEDIKKAMLRASKSTALEYGGKAKKITLDLFFYNKFAYTYPENGRSMYKYKYQFLHFINGDIVPIQPKIKGDSSDPNKPNNGLASLVIRKFKSEGVLVADRDRNEIVKAVDVALKVLLKNKFAWKQPETSIMADFPYAFYSCHRDNSKNPNSVGDVWYVATYKFEQHLKDKRYI